MEGIEPVRTIQKPRLLNAKFPGSVDRRKDSYSWLSNRSDPAVMAHLEAENNATEAAMNSTEALQVALYDEIKGRFIPADMSPPVRSEDGYWYYSYRKDDGQYNTIARRKLPDNMPPPGIHDEMDVTEPEQVLLDQSAMAKSSGSVYFNIGTISVSPNGQWMAYSLDVIGNEIYQLFIKKLVPPSAATSPKQLVGPIRDVSGGAVVWAQDNSTFFCTTVDPKSYRSNVVWRYAATAAGLSRGVMVLNETDVALSVDLSLSRNGDALFMFSASAATVNARMLNASTPTGAWVVLGPHSPGRQLLAADTRGGQVITLEVDRSRRNGELMVAPLQQPNNTEVLLEHSVNVQLESFAVSAGHLIVMARENGAVTPLVFSLPSVEQDIKELGASRALELPESAYTVGLEDQGPFHSTVSRLFYTSLSSPLSTLDFDLVTGNNAVKKQLQIAGGYDENNYRTERIWVTVEDDVKVPIDLMYRTELSRSGSRGCPLLLEAYGAYGVAVDPNFQSERLSLLDRGFVYALAHPRGGGELGEYWHEEGMMLKKRNTFTDVIAAVEHLIQEGYTTAGQVAIWGASAGGLTMGAVMNMRPDLFQAVILEVPFLDVLTSERDVTLPLTVAEWEEWGDPLHNKSAYDYIKSYSPLDNVQPQAYPHVLALGGLEDSRVGFWEPAKMAAKLRVASTSHNLVLLKVNMAAGHSTSTGRWDQMKEVAFKYAFLMTALSACTLRGSASGSRRGSVAAAAALVVALLAVLFALCGVALWSKAKGGSGSGEMAMRAFPKQSGFNEEGGHSAAWPTSRLLPAGHTDSASEGSAPKHRSQSYTQLSTVTMDRLARKK